jgi:class 3 adenylate cyclase/pimeloyl-ACP methyl ester carboxylesterase
VAEAERRLAAILFSDLAGYTAQMGANEERAIAAVQRARVQQRELVTRYHGDWLQEIGDGALCTFPSAVDAISCALEIQRVFALDPDVRLRIGIHVGDIVISGRDIFGDGVNIASRIQALASPGGICVSEKVYDEIRNKPGFEARPLGAQKLKNVDHLVSVFALESEPKPRPARRRLRVGVGAILTALVLVAGFFGADTDRRESLIAGFVLELPKWVGDPLEQKLGFATAKDGARIAYATTGEGEPIVQVLGWLTHLERGIFSPTYDAGDTLRKLSAKHRVVRYDGRGSGLSDRDVADMSLEARVADLEAVVEALGLQRFAIHAISAGGPTAITYASRHPERVTRIVFYSSFARSGFATGGGPDRARYDAIVQVMRAGWGDDSNAYRNVFTTLMAPDADSVQLRVVSEFLRIANNGNDASRMMESLLETDTSELAKGLRVPVLVLHSKGDGLVPFEGGGRDLAALVPGARLVVLDSRNHTISPTEAEFSRTWDETIAFFDEGVSSQASE